MSGCAVGITAAVERVRWSVWDDVAAMAPRSYAHAVQRAGALALLLPPDDVAEAEPERWLDRFDALLISGGSDVDPATYGQAPHPETTVVWPERDRFEIALARGALERGMPLLGVCRGMQIMNVALGGDLIQHLPDVLGHSDHREVAGSFARHEVTLAPGSLAARGMGAERVLVSSHHHQGLGELGEGLVPSGWSHGGEIVEAVEIDERTHPFALGVLWHPEEEEGRSPAIEALVDAARVRA